jgi:tetratricopeptide (TPR) repeat protein
MFIHLGGIEKVASVSLKSTSMECRLDGWKAIAQHIGRSCRTVQRWYTDYGLPIYRIHGEKSSVFAYSTELDDWIKNRDRWISDGYAGHLDPLSLDTSPATTNFNHQVQHDDFHLISESAFSRSAALTDHAMKFWPILSTGNIREMAQFFHKAIEMNLTNATAFAGLAQVMIVEGVWNLVRTPVACNAARSAMQWAMEIHSELPAAKCAAAWLKMMETRDWMGARCDFDELLKRHPPPPLTLIGRAALYIATGCHKEASGLLLEAAQESPLSSNEIGWYCWNEYLAGKFHNALRQVEEYRASGRTDPVIEAVEALVSIQLEEPNAQIKRLETLVATSSRNDVLRGALGYAFAKAGQPEKAIDFLASMTAPKSVEKNHEPFALALLLIGLDRGQEAVKWLERSYQEGSFWSLGFRYDPILATLVNDQHFQEFLSTASYPVSSCSDLHPGFTG